MVGVVSKESAHAEIQMPSVRNKVGDSELTEFDISHWDVHVYETHNTGTHRAQREAGYSDCFNRGYSDCAEEHCCFRAACQDDLIGSWKRAINKERGLEPEELICDIATAS